MWCGVTCTLLMGAHHAITGDCVHGRMCVHSSVCAAHGLTSCMVFHVLRNCVLVPRMGEGDHTLTCLSSPWSTVAYVKVAATQ